MSYYRIDESDTLYAVCDRCGLQFTFHARYLYRDEYNPDLCRGCKARPLDKVQFGNDYCVPWHGDYDPEDNPLLDGALYRPGVRTCGHRDCVRPAHIQAIGSKQIPQTGVESESSREVVTV